jgi:hypothetical protein
MGSSKREFEEIREKYILEVDKEYYESHYGILKPPNTKVIRSRVIGEDFSEDEHHKALLKNYTKHRDALRNYEYDARHGNIKPINKEK